MKLDKKAIAKRLRIFGKARFGTIKKFAEALDMKPPALQSAYLNARSLPGSVMIPKLIKYGLNIKWLYWEEGEMYDMEEISGSDILEKQMDELVDKAETIKNFFNPSKKGGSSKSTTD